MLNYRIEGTGRPLILLHGLFGNLDNLLVLAQALKVHYQVIRIDLRNHGLSPWFDDMNYTLMAQDIKALCEQLNLTDITVIGHSMGGKTAMALTALMPENIKKLVVMDIAPVAYALTEHGHQHVFAALEAVMQQSVTERRDAAQLMKTYLEDDATIQFLLKSFRQGQWKFNVRGLNNNAANIAGWQPIPTWQGSTLFIKGELSPYIQAKDKHAIMAQFPNAKFHQIAQCGHNVHAEKPDSVIRSIKRFLTLTE